MSDGYINIDTKIDETGLDKGIGSVDKKLKGVEKSTKSTAESFAGLGLKVAAAAGAVKIATDVISDLTDAYKTQKKAETQLEAAAKNNPYLDSSNVKNLEDYAASLSDLSGIADQELIPQMAKLAAAGRTNDEIMSIMSASVDMAASGAFSLDSAVGTLNKSFGGLAGELGESIPEIKSMTAEQLKQGGAVKLLAERYKGIAAKVREATGATEAFKTATTDAKEELGAMFEENVAPMENFFSKLISNWAKAKKEQRSYAEEGAKAVEAAGLSKDTEKKIKRALQLYSAGLSAAEKSGDMTKVESIINEIAKATGTTGLAVSGVAVKYKILSDEITNFTAKNDEAIRVEKEAADAAAKTAAATAAKTKKDKDAADYIAANTKAREAALKQLDLQAATEGRQVTAAEKLNVYAQSYVDLVSNSAGLVSENNSAAQSLLATTISIGKEVKDQAEIEEQASKLKEETLNALSAIQEDDGRKQSQILADQLTVLDNFYSEVMDNENISLKDKTKIQEEYAKKRKILASEITDAEKAENDKQIKDQMQKITDVLSIVNNFASQYASIMSSISSLLSEQIEGQATIETDAAEKAYADGTITAEEYEARIYEIKKKAAKEQYKIDMWTWGTNILTSVANTALGFTQALAQGGVIGIVTGALVAAAGAAQTAVILASKPTAPTYTTGGIVGGTSYTGDRVQALVNSGEMLLNAGQQRNLFDSINSGSVGSSSGSNIQVYNSASNVVSATPEITESGVKILIQKTVSQQMASGKYNKSYQSMQNSLKGTRITN